MDKNYRVKNFINYNNMSESVVAILLCTSMLAWYITRVKDKMTSFIYYGLTFSMIVPFQMVMFTLANTADKLNLNIETKCQTGNGENKNV